MGSNALTQSELKHSCQAQLLSLGNSINHNALRIEDIGNYIPGSVMVQDLSRMTNTYMNQTGCDILKHSSEELELLGPAYFSKFFPVEEITILKSELQNFAMENDAGRIHSFFQRVRPDNHSDYKWYFTTSRLYPSSDSGEGLKMMHIAIPADTLSYAGRKLSTLVQDDELIRKNLHKFVLLTLREKEVIRLIVEGKSSAEIANCLFLSIHTVNNHRKNIIHKLEVTSLSQLIKFAVAFAII
nr:helix-turn-helix transcriptional regulator [Pedobacter panaciterrae]